MKYNVPVIYRGLDNFIVEADTPEQAKEKAELAFKEGKDPQHLGNEWEEVLEIRDPEPLPSMRRIVRPTRANPR